MTWTKICNVLLDAMSPCAFSGSEPTLPSWHRQKKIQVHRGKAFMRVHQHKRPTYSRYTVLIHWRRKCNWTASTNFYFGKERADCISKRIRFPPFPSWAMYFLVSWPKKQRQERDYYPHRCGGAVVIATDWPTAGKTRNKFVSFPQNECQNNWFTSVCQFERQVSSTRRRLKSVWSIETFAVDESLPKSFLAQFKKKNFFGDDPCWVRPPPPNSTT